MPNYERTGWRDQWISERHRYWGRNLPVVDLDCVVTEGGAETDAGGWKVAEYDSRKPVAIVEYKRRGARIDLRDANNTTLRNLADLAGLPFFLVVYEPSTALFGVVPGNAHAKEVIPDRVVYTERQYVRFLHRIRGRTGTTLAQVGS